MVSLRSWGQRAATALLMVGSPAAQLDAGAIEEAIGATARALDDGTVRVDQLRTDVEVFVDGMRFDPEAGMRWWAAFRAVDGGALLIAEVALFEDEVDDAVDAALAAGIEVTGLHRHFFFGNPPLCYLRLRGTARPEALAGAVRQVWRAVRRLRQEQPLPQREFADRLVPAPARIPADAIAEPLGQPVTERDGVVFAKLSRKAAIAGVEVSASMGVCSRAAFSGSRQLAAVNGDLVVTAGEVQPVMRALRSVAFHPVSLHHHGLAIEPPLYAIRFWGKGSAEELSRGLRRVFEAHDN